MNDLEALSELVLAPYILKATALIGVRRKVGGNQFRHSFSTLGILLDYKFFQESTLLKAALIHDLIEDVPETQLDEIKTIDEDGPQVLELVLEVTKQNIETKQDYLERVLSTGSKNAKLLKSADRISNLTDLHRHTFTDEKISDYLDQTEQFIIPMAASVNQDMVTELTDLVSARKEILHLFRNKQVNKISKE